MLPCAISPALAERLVEQRDAVVGRRHGDDAGRQWDERERHSVAATGGSTPSTGSTSPGGVSNPGSTSNGTSTSGTPLSGGNASTPNASATSMSAADMPAATSAAQTAVSGGLMPDGAASMINLKSDVVAIHGMMVNGTYDPTVPVACGKIQTGSGGPGNGTPFPTTAAGTSSQTPSSSGTSSSGTPSGSGTSSVRHAVEQRHVLVRLAVVEHDHDAVRQRAGSRRRSTERRR